MLQLQSVFFWQAIFFMDMKFFFLRLKFDSRCPRRGQQENVWIQKGAFSQPALSKEKKGKGKSLSCKPFQTWPEKSMEKGMKMFGCFSSFLCVLPCWHLFARRYWKANNVQSRRIKINPVLEQSKTLAMKTRFPQCTSSEQILSQGARVPLLYISAWESGKGEERAMVLLW